MAIFSRRTLQRLLDESCASGLPRDRAASMIRSINAHSHEALENEWELVAFAALSRVASTRYEPDLGGPTRPDILLQDRSRRFPPILLEVATVSDRGLDDSNPVHELFDAIVAAARKSGVPPNSLALDVPAQKPGPRQPARSSLPIPSKGEIHIFVKKNIQPFLKCVAASPGVPAHLEVRRRRVALDLKYDPTQAWSRLSYVGYSPDTVRRNPIWNRLGAKTKQLSRAGHRGPAGVLLCDAGCSRMRDASFVGRVCTEVFRNHSEVSFIAVANVSSRSSMARYSLRVSARVHLNPKAAHPTPDGFDSLLISALEALPQARSTPSEAYGNLRRRPGPLWGSLYGGWKGSQKEFRMSVRTAQMLLAESLDLSEYLEAHQLSDMPRSRGVPNYLAGMLRAGHTIVSSRVERLPDVDDDWLVLTFSERPDPALAGLVLPSSAVTGGRLVLQCAVPLPETRATKRS